MKKLFNISILFLIMGIFFAGCSNNSNNGGTYDSTNKVVKTDFKNTKDSICFQNYYADGSRICLEFYPSEGPEFAISVVYENSSEKMTDEDFDYAVLNNKAKISDPYFSDQDNLFDFNGYCVLDGTETYLLDDDVWTVKLGKGNTKKVEMTIPKEYVTQFKEWVEELKE